MNKDIVSCSTGSPETLERLKKALTVGRHPVSGVNKKSSSTDVAHTPDAARRTINGWIIDVGI
uniref:Uncharacterized protein n=1 Tax=Glossina palpalis gambiensis TaxID=67801 RepID=A0A1B0C587_9MUSC